MWVPDNAWPSQPEQSWQQPAQPAYPASGYAAPDYAVPDYPAPDYPAPDYSGPEYQQQAFPQPGYGPTGPQPAGPVTGGSPPSGGRQPRWPVVAGIILAAALLGGGAGGYILVAHPFSHSPSSANNVADSSTLPATSRPGSSAPASTAPASSAAAPATPVSTPSPSQSPAEEQAASALSRLLTQSVSDRSAINQAYNDVSACGSLLSQDQQTFQQAASSRQSLISQLSSLPDAQSLPAAMLSDLTGAWQASQQVDQDYAQWANDENSQGCTSQDYTDPSYEAADSPNQQATADKTAFVGLWNPIASKYGLPTYSQGEI